MSNILLIEPDRPLASTYARTLRAAKHRVVVCTGAQAGITAADQQMPDIIILELQLVGHSGIEFLHEFRSYPEWQRIPIVIHSQVPPGEFSLSQRLLEGELGVRAYLYKPRTSLRQLLGAVHDHLPVMT